jgi:hypothetical protein
MERSIPIIGTRKQLIEFAQLVQQLRNVQEANGTGYKTPQAKTQASGLEAQVEAMVNQILG